MIKSCKKCKTKCCRAGPGPYRKVSVQKFLSNWGEAENYNSECEYLNSDGMCDVWGTKHLPYDCRIFICCVRTYSHEELKAISKIIDNW